MVRALTLTSFLATCVWADLPAGWQMRGSAPQDYQVDLDTTTKVTGKASARMRLATKTPTGYGTFQQTVDATGFRGKRVRFSAGLRTRAVQRWAGLFLRVYNGASTVALDNMQERALKDDNDWKRFEVVLDIDPEATELSFGVLLAGAGTVWIDDVMLEEVSKSVAVTSEGGGPPALPSNLGGENAELGGWFLSGGAAQGYRLARTESAPHGGKACLELTPLDLAPNGYGVAMQLFDAKRAVGKRIRFTAFIKTQGVTARGDFWARVQGSDSPEDGPGLSYRTTPLKASADWTRYELVLDVPQHANNLQFGIGIQGPGRLWVDDVTFETVAKTVPLAPPSPSRPVNPSFEEL